MKHARLGRWASLTLLCAPLCAQPVLDRMQPRGAQAGSAAQLVLTGKRLGPAARLIADAGIVATPLSRPSEQAAAPPNRLEYLIEVGDGTAHGVYPVRIETEEGLSNALLFAVGAFPQAEELESFPDPESEEISNDFLETAQSIQSPVTVEGRLQGPERDLFRLHAAAGQNIVAEVAARRLGSAVDPHLELLDDAGKVLVRSGDAAGLGLDSRLAFKAPVDADYILSVRDERFSTQKQDFYRLTVGDFQFADSVFPLGWAKGAKVRAEFSGGNLPEPMHAQVGVGDEVASATETWIRVPGTASSVPFVLGSGAEALESESGGLLREGVVVNGRIDRPKDTDTYRLPVAGGEQWAFELRSGELPGSSLYGVLTIAAGDEVLAVAGKYAGDPTPYVITTTGETATYPFVNLTVPPGVSELTLSVEDLLGRGGRRFSYRLSARKQGPDFLLSVNEPYVNIPRDGSAVVNVTAERRGYDGPIQLYVDNLPEDVVASGGHIAPTSRLNNAVRRFASGRLTLTALPGADLRRLNLVVRGRATQDGREQLDRRASGPGIRVNVAGAKQEAVTAGWLGYDLPARINPEQAASLRFATPRKLRLVRGGRGLLAEWSYKARKPGARLTKKFALPRNAGSLRLRRVGEGDKGDAGTFRIFTHERTSLGIMNFNLTATVRLDGRDQPLVSKPLEIDVVDGYTLPAPPERLVLAAGAEGRWTGSIWRDPEFTRTVKVNVVGLPSSIRCEEVELTGDSTAYELPCSAGADAPEGEHEVEVRAESVLSDEGTTPYLAEPVQAYVAIRR